MAANSNVVVGEWLGPTAGGCLNFPTCANNPQFLFSISADGVYRLELRQKARADFFPICLSVVKKGGKRVKSVYEGEMVADSGKFARREVVFVDATLKKAEGPFTLLPATFNPGQENSFEIHVSGPAAFTISPVPEDENPLAGLPHVTTMKGEWKGVTAGGNYAIPSGSKNPQYNITPLNACKIAVVLKQANTKYAVCVIITDVGGGRIMGALTKAQMVADSGSYTASSEVIAFANVDASKRLTVMPSTFNAGETGEFELSVHSNYPVALTVAEAVEPTKGPTLPFSITCSSEWLGETAGGCFNFETCENNPQFFLTVTERTDVSISLRQCGESLASISLTIVDKRGYRANALTEREFVANSGKYVNLETVVCNTTLEPREHPYTVFVSTFSPGIEMPFELTVKSSVPVELREAERDIWSSKGLICVSEEPGSWVGKSAGGCVNFTSVCANPQFVVTSPTNNTVAVIVRQRKGPNGFHAMGVTAARCRGERIIILYKDDVVGRSGVDGLFESVSEVYFVFQAKADVPYTILPSTYNPGEEADFVLYVRAADPVNLVPLPPYIDPLDGLTHELTVVNRWQGSTAAGCTMFKHAGMNPQYHLFVEEPNTRIAIILQQSQEDFSALFPISILVADKGGEKVRDAVTQSQMVASSGDFVNKMDVMAVATVRPRAYPYTILPSTYYPKMECQFSIRVLSDKPVQLRDFDEAAVSSQKLLGANVSFTHFQEVSGEWSVEKFTAGGCYNYSTATFNPQYLLTIVDPATTFRIILRQVLEDDEASTSIGFVLFRQSGLKRISRFMGEDAVASSGDYVDIEKIEAIVTLDPPTGHDTYVLFASTFQPCVERHFSLSIQADKPFDIVSLGMDGIEDDGPTDVVAPAIRTVFSESVAGVSVSAQVEQADLIKRNSGSRPAGSDDASSTASTTSTDSTEVSATSPSARGASGSGVSGRGPPPQSPTARKPGSSPLAGRASSPLAVGGTGSINETTEGSKPVESPAVPSSATTTTSGDGSAPPMPPRTASVRGRPLIGGPKPGRTESTSGLPRGEPIVPDLPRRRTKSDQDDIHAASDEDGSGGSSASSSRSQSPGLELVSSSSGKPPSGKAAKAPPGPASVPRRPAFSVAQNTGTTEEGSEGGKSEVDAGRNATGGGGGDDDEQADTFDADALPGQDIRSMSRDRASRASRSLPPRPMGPSTPSRSGSITSIVEGKDLDEAVRRPLPAPKRSRVDSLSVISPQVRKSTTAELLMADVKQPATKSELRDILLLIHRLFDESATNAEIMDLVLLPDRRILQALFNLPSTEAESLMPPLFAMFSESESILLLAKMLITQECTKNTQSSALMRGNGLTSKILTTTCLEVGREYIADLLRPLVDQIKENPLKYLFSETATTVTDEGREVIRNFVVLVATATKAMFTSPKGCPVVVKNLMCILRSTVVEYGFTEDGFDIKLVGGLFFLRVLCPALITPMDFGLMDAPPSADCKKVLIFVSKTLQRLANHARFIDTSRPYTEIFNRFLDSSQGIVTSFLDQLSTPEPGVSNYYDMGFALHDYDSPTPSVNGRPIRLMTAGDRIDDIMICQNSDIWLWGTNRSSRCLLPVNLTDVDIIDISQREMAMRDKMKVFSTPGNEHTAALRAVIMAQREAIVDELLAPFRTKMRDEEAEVREDRSVTFSSRVMQFVSRRKSKWA